MPHRPSCLPRAPLAAVCAVLPFAAGCAVVPEDAQAKIHASAEIADKFVHRGMPQNRNGVLQGTLDTTLPTKGGDSLTIGTFANVDLQDSTGAAWFPGGHAGRVSQFELTGTWAHTFEDGVALAAGLHNYNVPFGESFPQGPRESTNELFVNVAADVLGARPELQFRHDFDQAEGSYLRLGVNEEFELAEAWLLELRSHIAWSSAAQSSWNYGIADSGLADAEIAAVVTWTLDKHTTIGASAHASTLLDSGIRDWLDLVGIPETNYWLTLFVNWDY